MSEMIEGVIHGRSIVLEADPGLADGQRVKVRIEPAAAAPTPGPVPEDEGKVYTPLTDPALIAVLEQVRRGRPPLPPSPSGPGRKSTAGVLADDPEFDAVMAEIERERRADFGREVL